MVGHIGHASLTVFTEDNIGKNLSTLWNAEALTYNWKKKVLELPTTLHNYSVVFLGFFEYWGHYVIIDDITFRRCNPCKFLCFYFTFLIRFSKVK